MTKRNVTRSPKSTVDDVASRNNGFSKNRNINFIAADRFRIEVAQIRRYEHRFRIVLWREPANSWIAADRYMGVTTVHIGPVILSFLVCKI